MAAKASEPVHARLEYDVDERSYGCISESEFRGEVAARLGYDPFDQDATWIVRVHIDGRKKPARAQIVTERDGKVTGRRHLDDATCEALSKTIASTVAIAIDPGAGTPKAAPAPPSPTTPGERHEPTQAPAPTQASQAPAPSVEHSAPLEPFIDVAATVTFGRTAGTALGGRLGAGFRYRALSVAAEARGEATPGSVRLTPIDETHWSAFSGAIVPCGHRGVVALCGVLTLGGLQGKAEDVTRPSLTTTFFGSVGARLGLEVPIANALAFRTSGELGFPLVRTTFLIAGEPVWTTPIVQGTLAVGLNVRFR